LRYSAIKIQSLNDSVFPKFILQLLSIYIRFVFIIHKPLLLSFDGNAELQDNPVGHFSMSRKSSKPVHT
jgi:hypothetical protein